MCVGVLVKVYVRAFIVFFCEDFTRLLHEWQVVIQISSFHGFSCVKLRFMFMCVSDFSDSSVRPLIGLCVWRLYHRCKWCALL